MIISFSGKIGSGKDFAASICADLLSNKFPIYHKSFAFKLKQIAEIVTNIKMKTNYSNNFINGITDFSRDEKNIFIPEYKMTIGELFQKLGTDALRDNFDKDIWVKSLFIDYGEYEKNNTMWIITDVRFENEIIKIKELNGKIIRIEGDPKKFNQNALRNKKHSSETSLDNYNNFDFIIKNDKSPEDLKNNIEKILKDLKYL